MQTEELISALRRRAAYPDTAWGAARGEGEGEVGFLQTHISLLFFAGQRVYKVKKPVDLGFLDFTTLARRRHFCEEEVRLNRRLAPGVYLGVVPIVRARSVEGGLEVGGEGEPLEWAVEMVRLPEERMLSSLLERGELDNRWIGRLVERLATFHAAAATGPGVDEHGAPAAVRHNVEENFRQLEPFVAPPTSPISPTAIGRPLGGFDPGRVTALSAPAHAFLARRADAFLAREHELLERRVREGRIRDGHGDLHAGNVCFPGDDVVAYDCIEFADRFRCADVACDLAFLPMDLDLRGFPGFARFLVHRYARRTRDPELLRLIDFYKGYRAVVRGKVAALAAADPGLPPGERAARRLDALRHHALAAGYELGPALLLVGGLPGTGKSWLAERLARVFRAVELRSDVRRKVLAGIAPSASAAAPHGRGLYAPELRERTYRSLLELAARALARGRTVVVDAGFGRRSWRSGFLEAAARYGRPCLLVHVTAAEELVRERMRRRAAGGQGPSDADLAIHRREAELFEPPDELDGEAVIAARSQEDAAEETMMQVVDARIASEP